MVFVNCLVSFCSDAAYSEHSQLVEIVGEWSIFECNIQAFRDHHNYKNMLSSRMEICS